MVRRWSLTAHVLILHYPCPRANTAGVRAQLKNLPQRFFMLFRVITILRGLLATYDLHVSAAEMWEPFAKYVSRPERN
jgi:hypothetical protein